MQFKFDANQEFQVKAVDAVADLFDGQPNSRLLPSIAIGERQLELAGAPAKNISCRRRHQLMTV